MTPLTIALISGSLLFAFVLLLRIEAKHEHRVVLSRVRGVLDRFVVHATLFFTQLRMHAGSGTIRIFFHQALQKCLTYLLRIIAWIGLRLEEMRTRNRMIVRSVRESREKSHLDLIAEHKAQFELTEEERTARKERALESE